MGLHDEVVAVGFDIAIMTRAVEAERERQQRAAEIQEMTPMERLQQRFKNGEVKEIKD